MKTNKNIMLGKMNCKVVLSPEELKLGIQQIAVNIAYDYKDKESPILLCIINGGIFFGTSLSVYLEKFDFLHIIETIRIKRYESDGIASNIKIISEPVLNLKNKDIIVIEDLVDEGYSLKFINEYLKEKGARSIEFAVLIEKKNHISLDFQIKYKILDNYGPEWLIGFGMDSDNLYRGLDYIVAKINKTP